MYDATLANPPGSTYLYSDLNMITAGKLVELVTGKPLDQVVHDAHHRAAGDERHRVQPAGVRARPDRRDGVRVRAAARHGPRQRARRERLGAERCRRARRSLLHRRRPRRPRPDHHQRRVLRQGPHPEAAEPVDALLHNENAAFPGNSHGLGFELDQRWYMDGLSSPDDRRPHRATPAPRSSSTRCRGRSSSCSPTGCTRAATGAATTRPVARSPATWRWPSRSAARRAHGVVLRGRGRAHRDADGSRAAARRIRPDCPSTSGTTRRRPTS